MAALQELAQGSQRALGFGGSNESWRKDPENEDEDEDDSSSTVAGSSRHYPGGMPVTLGQRVLRLIQAGFTPKDEEFLYDELKKILSRRMSSIIKKYHFTVTQSAEAFIIPDPFGILEPGEIHFTSTQPLNDAVLSSDPYTITGDVLLEYLQMSRKCEQFIVKHSRTGGDMDGDVAVCIFDPALVTPFENSSITSPPDGFLDKNFQPESAVQRVASLHAELSTVSSQRRCKILQNCLLSGLSDARIGIYSKYHEVMIYARGYDHPETIRNAFMFNTLLDSRKTGLRVLEEVAASDKKKYSYDLPPCMSDTAEADDKEYNYPKRNVRGAFILDQLLDVGKRICDKQLQRYEEAGKAIAFREVRHDDMLKPYTNKVSVHWLSPELRQVEAFVKQSFQRWKEFGKEGRRKKERILARDFTRGPPEENTKYLSSMGLIEETAASYAYSIRPIFAFHVAFRTLCAIKANSKKSVAVTEEFATMMAVTSSAVRLLSQGSAREGTEEDGEWLSDNWIARTSEEEYP
ncbi:hypothetical protein EW026_g7646 [Hermanssonia centrifuga]|uniref:RNA-dependent RNA polymerase n=1 Tax=Hermanssonia centrifuga TaxID=98765 RepID=A0A4S4K8X9_9APHY|nr:hypothetical protein EW026_g7646 [Hermanssonia centrifuga]